MDFKANLSTDDEPLDFWPVVQGLCLLLFLMSVAAPALEAAFPLQSWLPDPKGLLTLLCIAVQFIPSPGPKEALYVLAGFGVLLLAKFDGQLVLPSAFVLLLAYLWTRALRKRFERWTQVASELGLSHSRNSENLLEGTIGSVSVTMRRHHVSPEGPIPTCVRMTGQEVGSWSAWCDDLEVEDAARFVRGALDAVTSCQLPADWAAGKAGRLHPGFDATPPSSHVRSGLEIAVEKLSFLKRTAVAFEGRWMNGPAGWAVVINVVFSNATSQSYEAITLASHPVINGAVEAASHAAAAMGEALASQYGVEFYFPSPNRPKADCPRWWELAPAIRGLVGFSTLGL